MNKKDRKIRIFSGLVIIFIAGIIFFGSKFFGKKDNTDNFLNERNVTDILYAENYEKINIENTSNDYDEISSLYICKDNNEKTTGYIVFTDVKDDTLAVAFDDKCETIKNLQLFREKNSKTNNIDTNVLKETLLNKPVPIKILNSSYNIGYNDGNFREKSKSYNSEGYLTEVTINISDGKIKDVNWDELDKNGVSKKNLSIKNEYSNNSLGKLRWHEQAELAEEELIRIQDPKEIKIDDMGRIVSIENFTIDAKPFLELAQKCIEKSEKSITENYDPLLLSENYVPVINGINISCDFVKENFSG